MEGATCGVAVLIVCFWCVLPLLSLDPLRGGQMESANCGVAVLIVCFWCVLPSLSFVSLRGGQKWRLLYARRGIGYCRKAIYPSELSVMNFRSLCIRCPRI